MCRGDIVGCQLFSEPSSGSDLASLQTRAVRDGDEWVVNGQKVWTSGAQLSDIGEIICRTDPDLPKHRGLTGFVVDMHAPGVEVRPLRQMTGGASFNEVFFTDVRVPDSHRLGDVNGGWTVALTTLMNERAAIGGGGGGVGPPTVDPADRGGPGRSGRHDDPLVRQQLAEISINDTGRRLHQPAGHGQDRRGPAARARDVAGQALPDRQHGAHLRGWCPPSSVPPWWSTPASGAPTPGPVPARACPGCGSPAAPTRSCATSSASGSSACPRTRPRRSPEAAASSPRSHRGHEGPQPPRQRRPSRRRRTTTPVQRGEAEPASAVRCTGDGYPLLRSKSKAGSSPTSRASPGPG